MAVIDFVKSEMIFGLRACVGSIAIRYNLGTERAKWYRFWAQKETR